MTHTDCTQPQRRPQEGVAVPKVCWHGLSRCSRARFGPTHKSVRGIGSRTGDAHGVRAGRTSDEGNGDICAAERAGGWSGRVCLRHWDRRLPHHPASPVQSAWGRKGLIDKIALAATNPHKTWKIRASSSGGMDSISLADLPYPSTGSRLPPPAPWPQCQHRRSHLRDRRPESA